MKILAQKVLKIIGMLNIAFPLMVLAGTIGSTVIYSEIGKYSAERNVRRLEQSIQKEKAINFSAQLFCFNNKSKMVKYEFNDYGLTYVECENGTKIPQ